MHLTLVTDNTIKDIDTNEVKNSSNCKTCRANCVLFNKKHESCPIFKGLDYDDPTVVKRCMEFNDIATTESLYTETLNDGFKKDTEMDFLFNLVGVDNHTNDSSYPIEPEIRFDETMEGIYWYVSPDKSFGCWVKRHNKLPFSVLPNSREEAEKGWVDNIYRSPLPLHDHQASQSLKTRMCWFVDSEGWGQYTLIVANKIKFITYPKPTEFRKY